tara:strand:+ start:6240 stop:6890 length:651 start_codon:yes stop_codon:yes gene_type:complete
MIVIGAKGFAKELLEDLVSIKYGYNETNLFFFDDVSNNLPQKLFGKYLILTTFDEVKKIFNTVSNEFSIGIGSPKHRKFLSKKFEKIGGELTKVISNSATIGSFGNQIENGVVIMGGNQITNNIKIGKGTLINLNCTIGHDTVIGEFVEITPGVNISGNCSIGDYTTIGTGVKIIPNIKIGQNCIVGAGTVVTKDFPDNSVIVGVPGKIIKQNVPL